MRILVKGSMSWRNGDGRQQRFSGKEAYETAFKAACRALGKKLAERNHVILIGSYCKETVGPHVLKGADSVSGARAEAYRPQDERYAGDKFCKEPTSLAQLDLVSRRNPGSWSEALLPALKEADAMITMGGGTNTQAVGFAARALEIPNLAVPIFAGEAEKLWRMSRYEYEEKYLIEPEMLDVLWRPSAPSAEEADESQPAEDGGPENAAVSAQMEEGNWDAWAEGIVEITEEMARRHQRLYSRRGLLAMLLSAPLLLVIWAAIIFLLGNVTVLWQQWTLFILAFVVIVSALLGTLLRVTVRLLGPRSVRLSLSFLIPEIVGGLIVAFVLWLLYMLGGIAYPDSSPEDILHPSSPAQAVRVALAVSFLSLIAALLLERAYGSVSRRGEALLEE